MRGLVMEVKNDTLVVLTSQGEYIHVKNTGTSAIGDFVPCNNPAPAGIPWIPRNVLALAASLMLVCSLGLGTYGYSQPFGVVNIDINPSIALTYNWFQQVIATEALNTDGTFLLKQVGSLKHQPVTKAVAAIVSEAADSGYLKPELANVVFISVSDRNDPSQTQALLQTLDRDFPNLDDKTEVVLLAGDAKTYEQMKDLHNSPVKDLIEAGLKEVPGKGPLTHSDKTLKEILKDQKDQRDQEHRTPASETTAPNGIPQVEAAPGQGTEKPSKKLEKPLKDKKNISPTEIQDEQATEVQETSPPDPGKPDHEKPNSLKNNPEAPESEKWKPSGKSGS